MGVGLRPGAKASEAPPMPFRPRASPRLYTNGVGTLTAVPRRRPPQGFIAPSSRPGGSVVRICQEIPRSPIPWTRAPRLRRLFPYPASQGQSD